MPAFEVRTGIDLHDIQGNIVKGYGRFGFPVARNILFRVNSEAAGRQFVDALRLLITTSAPWTHFGSATEGTKTPSVTTNIAFTFAGLRAVGVPEKSLLSFPEEFASGMRPRGPILGDDGPSAAANWDPVWRSDEHPQPVHVLVTINAANRSNLEARYAEILTILQKVQRAHPTAGSPIGVEQLAGHRDEAGDTALFQDCEAVTDSKGRPTAKEHFGYTDGISDPFFRDSGNYPTYVQGGGKRVRGQSPTIASGWAPIANGEFILGTVDEADEYPAAPIPSVLSKNGSFLVLRKLHENVGSFAKYVAETGAGFGDPELFAAKLVGRWKNGAPLSSFPTRAEADAFIGELNDADFGRRDESSTDAKRAAAKARYYELKQRLMAFDFDTDLEGARCPVGAHIRRVNSRSGLEFGVKGAFSTPGALVNRRRILRRGLPYGRVVDRTRDDGNHGIIFMAVCASISRQFEFVQQQWVNYGNDFKLANDRDPVIGNHPVEGGRMVIEGDATSGKAPYFCAAIPRFVETRGGDYFFIPSLTALAAIAGGRIDPT